MDENTCWLRTIQTAAIALVFVLSNCAIKDYYSELNVVALVKAGASPLQARCAIYGTDGRQAVCLEAERVKK